ncbi:MAG: AAA-like domain-containing protein [Lachnospiraceae bacterium]|nr:AAA-like domain-containing protein [Lachnospiraceae bacterium]
MVRKFNVTGLCVPEKHYMVDISKKLERIVAMIEDDEYFTINRARQYGKTTTLSRLDEGLRNQYTVLQLSFEGVGDGAFSNDKAFVQFLIKKIATELEYGNHDGGQIELWADTSVLSEGDAFDNLSDKITELCRTSDQEIVLMIDEVDKSSDNQIFLNFLGMLRNKYLLRQKNRDVTFKSVILAGVYDVKNLKLKLRSDEEQKYNSPWNIAADFNVDMSFSAEEIATMLSEYEKDYHTGMDVERMSRELYFYTSGYPFLVSRLCKWIDEDGDKKWTVDNLRTAEKELLKCRNTLFDDLIKNIENNGDLKQLITNILYYGYTQGFNLSDPVIQKGAMLGILSEKDHEVAISNVIFETYLYDYLVSVNSREHGIMGPERNQFVKDGGLDVLLILTKFQDFMRSEYRQEDEKFVERQGRLLFLCFLKPIINGTGFYYVEPETRNSTRMDIVVAYGGEEHIIELKIWRGDAYRKEGIHQLEGYMDSRGAEVGYMVSFSFLKEKEYRSGWLKEDESEKKIFEVVV